MTKGKGNSRSLPIFDGFAMVAHVVGSATPYQMRLMTYSELADRISAVPLRHGRRIIAIAGVPWLDPSADWDLSIAIDVPLQVLEHCLVQRWLDHGLTLDAARLRAARNDIPNARLVTEHSQSPDIRFRPQL